MEMLRKILSPILKAISGLYDVVTRLRNRGYESGILFTSSSRLPVISVGNVTAGGNAKTPLCLYLAKGLLERGHHPVIVSRGYGGSERGPYWVGEGDSADKVGDEPIYLAGRSGVPVVVSRKRAAGAAFVEGKGLGDCIILDDGFQHRRLKRDLDILCINTGSEKAVEEFLEGNLLPFGLFREDRDNALRRSDLIIFSERRTVTGDFRSSERLRSLMPVGKATFHSFLKAQGVYSLTDGAALSPCEVAAFCGIANPDGFFESLRNEGFTPITTKVYPDHYQYKLSNIQKLKASYPGLPLVCTEKDGVKLRQIGINGIYEFRVELKVEPEKEFWEKVVQVFALVLC